MEALRDPAGITGYHAHIYYLAETRDHAAALRQALDETYATALRLGRWHDVPVGPHPIGMYQVAFAAAVFPSLVPWLMLNRGGLSILVHPLTGDDYEDHAQNALWLGPPQPLLLETLRRGDRSGGDRSGTAEPKG